VIPIIWGIYGYYKSRGDNNNNGRQDIHGSLVLNSAVAYALAFNIIFFIQELFLALGKSWLGLEATLFHNNHNWKGSHPMEMLAQGYGAFAILICGIIGYLLLSNRTWIRGYARLFLVWFSFQGMAQSLPQFITAKAAPDTDTGQAFTYLGIDYVSGSVIIIICLVCMLLICAYTSRLLLELAPSPASISSSGSRFKYSSRIVLLGSLIGTILIIPFRIMPWDRAIAPVMVWLISIPMVFAHSWYIKRVSISGNDVNMKFKFIPFVVLVFLLLVFQLILAPGIRV